MVLYQLLSVELFISFLSLDAGLVETVVESDTVGGDLGVGSGVEGVVDLEGLDVEILGLVVRLAVETVGLVVNLNVGLLEVPSRVYRSPLPQYTRRPSTRVYQ